MKKEAKSNSALFLVLSLILLFLIIIAILVYGFRGSFFENKLRGIEAGENVAEAYVKNEETAFVALKYDSDFNLLNEIIIIFYDDKGNKYSYASRSISYSQEVDVSELDLKDFSSIKGVYAEYLFNALPHPGNETNQTSQAETQLSLTPLSEFWSWLKSLL